MNLLPSFLSQKPFAAMALALSLLLAFSLDSAAAKPTAVKPAAFSFDAVDAMKASIRGLIATPEGRQRYLRSGVTSLLDAIAEMASRNALELEYISARMTVVDSHLEHAERSLPSGEDYSKSREFCHVALDQLNGGLPANRIGGFHAQVDLLARNASRARADVAALSRDILAGAADDGEAQDAIDAADSVLNTRRFVSPAIAGINEELNFALEDVDTGVLAAVNGATDSYCHTFTPIGWDPVWGGSFRCQAEHADVVTQTQYVFDWLSYRVKRDPWTDLSRSSKAAVRGALDANARLAREIRKIAAMIPEARESEFQHVRRDLKTSLDTILETVDHLVKLQPNYPLPDGDRRSQVVIEAAKSMAKTIGGLVDALRELGRIRSIPLQSGLRLRVRSLVN